VEEERLSCRLICLLSIFLEGLKETINQFDHYIQLSLWYLKPRIQHTILLTRWWDLLC